MNKNSYFAGLKEVMRTHLAALQGLARYSHVSAAVQIGTKGFNPKFLTLSTAGRTAHSTSS